MTPATSAAERIAVVGAGIVGLSTAWFLQEQGAEVTIYDSGEVGDGASWGNAGWITPGMAAPLPEPAIMRGAPRMLLDRSSPVTIQPSLDPRLPRFMLGFALNATHRRWKKGMAAFAPLNRGAYAAYDALRDGGVATEISTADPLVAAWATEAERAPLVTELRHLAEFGVAIDVELVSGDEARALQPILSDGVGVGLLMRDQRYVDPRILCTALAAAIEARGGIIHRNSPVSKIEALGRSIVVHLESGETIGHSQVVITTGAVLGRLARPFGVRAMVQAGRGYSFTVKPAVVPSAPVYLPGARLACTPLGDRLRIAGLMEFSRPDAPMTRGRIDTMVAAARDLFTEVDLDSREEEWVGSRPVTTDGVPLIGRTRDPRVHVAGGHGMWGVALGPETGRLLARQILSGQPQPELAAVDPLR